VLARLHALQPKRVVLVEQDVEYPAHDAYARFANCLSHYGALFELLDRTPMAQAERDALKVGRMGREVAAIVAGVEPGLPGLRGQVQRASTWLQRLRATGFEPVPAPAVASAWPQAAEHPALQACLGEGHLSLGAAGEPVAAVFTARPRAVRAAAEEGEPWAA
jgi:hypothetical protein